MTVIIQSPLELSNVRGTRPMIVVVVEHICILCAKGYDDDDDDAFISFV